MRSMGTLKLPEKEAEKFVAALEHYGFEKSAIFLRRCAMTLIRHHASEDTIAHDLSNVA